MERKAWTSGLVLAALIGLLMIGPLGGSQATAATEEEIEAAIDIGVFWLADQQNADGSWGGYEEAAHTGLALVELQEYAYELGKENPEIESPFDPDYLYSDNVIAGWDYLLQHVYEEGGGVYFGSGWSRTYSTGICLMALAATGTPDRPGVDLDGDANPETFQEIAQEAVDWLAFAQVGSGAYEGGWGYEASEGWADNSNSGYAVLGLAYGEDFGCTVPDEVKTKLDKWIDFIQGDDGGSGYSWPNDWTNVLKTGNLIFQMTFVGDDPGVQRFQDALDYIELHWRDQNQDPGWGYNGPSHRQAMYCLMKGFEYSGIDLIDTDGDGERDDDWFNQDPPASPAQDFASVLVAHQQLDGAWPWDYWGDEILSTTWALLTLEKVAPPPPVIEVPIDVKPQSWPNPLNVNSRGMLPVAILGTQEFDVSQVDPESVALMVGLTLVEPLRWSLEDVATPVEPYIGKGEEDGTDAGPDGQMDLTLKFDTQEVVQALGDVSDRERVLLTIVGALKEEFGGTAIVGEDWVIILTKGEK